MFLRNNILMTMVVLLSVFSIHALTVCGPAQAATVINVDFLGHPDDNNPPFNPVYTGQGAFVTSDAHFWNGYTLFYTLSPATLQGNPAPMSSLKTSDGTTVTTVGFDLTTENTGSFVLSPPDPFQNLLNDYAYTTNSSPTSVAFTISGLTSGHQYDLYLYGTAGAFANIGSIFHINNGSPTDKRTKGGNDTSFVAGDVVTNPFVAGSNYVLFSNVLPDGSNNITGTMTTNGDSVFGVFNGLQIVFTEAVPEPSTYVLGLIGMAGLGLVALRKKFRRALHSAAV